MKTATFPPLRVHPSLRQDAENVLKEGESLSKFSESAIRAQIEYRKAQADFLVRGLTSRNNALKTGEYVSSQDALMHLEGMLTKAKSTKE